MNRHESDDPRKAGREAERQRKTTRRLVLVIAFLAGIVFMTLIGRMGWFSG